jgi:hypothetical protein
VVARLRTSNAAGTSKAFAEKSVGVIRMQATGVGNSASALEGAAPYFLGVWFGCRQTAGAVL